MELMRALEDLYIEARLPEGDAGRETGDARPGDQRFQRTLLAIRRSRRTTMTPQGNDRDAAKRKGGQQRDGGLGSASWENQFEQRSWITKSLLQWSERTVAASDDQPNALHRQCRHSRAQYSVTAAGQGAKPDVTEAADSGQPDRDVSKTQDSGLPV